MLCLSIDLPFYKMYKEIKNISLQSRKIADLMSMLCYLGDLNKDLQLIISFYAKYILFSTIIHAYTIMMVFYHHPIKSIKFLTSRLPLYNNKDSIIFELVDLD